MGSEKYELRGVSSSKDEVHTAISKLDKGVYAKSFCKLLPDIVAGDEKYCNCMHADTAGTKTSLAYIYWRETADLSVWKGIAQDALVMNLDDMACVGIIDNMLISSTIGRNKKLIPAKVLQTLIEGTIEFIDKMKQYDIHIFHSGGETADVGDIVRTIDVGVTAFGRIKKENIIINNIQPRNVIVGFASYGKAIYEDTYTGGIGSNGLTSARHDILHKKYAEKYPESYDANIPADLIYAGSKKLTDKISELNTDYGKLILSPTRTYLPVLKIIIERFKNSINGIIHCTGGGQTKVLNFVDTVHIIKNNLFPVPPLFKIIQEESHTGWQEMYKVFNMGHRMEIYSDEKTAEEIIAISKQFNIDAQIIGYVEESDKRKLTIINEFGEFVYKE